MITACAFGTAQPGTVPIYVHEAGGPDRYYYDQLPSNAYGWGPGTVAFHAHPTEAPGTVPIYIHQAGGPDRYYYDRQPTNNYGWSPGNVAFYAYAPDAGEAGHWRVPRFP
jgi:hypothetical protein